MPSIFLALLAVQAVGSTANDEAAAQKPSPRQEASQAVASENGETSDQEKKKSKNLQFPSIASTAPQASQEYAALYSPFDFQYPESPGVDEKQQVHKYRLYQPADIKENERLPMFVWLHGLEEYGSNNYAQLRWLNNMMGFDEEGLKERRMYVLAMQCPTGTSWGGENEVVLKAIIDHVLANHPINPNKLFLSGISAGGSGCWTMAIRYPEIFAGILSLSGVGGSASEMHRIKDVPIWAFYKIFDGIEPVRQTVNALKEAGGRVHLTEQKGMGHIVNISGYVRIGLLDSWLFLQERGKPATDRPPGTINDRDLRATTNAAVYEGDDDGKEDIWLPHQLALQIGVPALVVLACFQEYRRRSSAIAKDEGREVE